MRRRCQDLFERGSYLPLAAEGKAATRVVAFARQLDNQAVIVLAGRFFLGHSHSSEYDHVIGDAWRGNGIQLPASLAGHYRDVITGVEIGEAETQERSGTPASLLHRMARQILSLVAGGASPTRLPLAKVFRHLPIALLERIGGGA